MVDYIHVSNGDGLPVTAIVTTDRGIGSTNLITDSILNWPTYGIAMSGTINETTGIITNRSVFKYHLEGSIIIIETFAPGYNDIGNMADQVVVIKPTTAWGDEVADTLANFSSLPDGGTTGQVLAKASNTDQDVAWVDDSGVGLVPKEIPTGLVDGSNTAFTTSQGYVAGSLLVYINGLAEGLLVTEVSPTAGTFTLSAAPLTGDNVFVSYQHAMATTLAADTVDNYHANATPTANTIPVLDSSARVPKSALALDYIASNFTVAGARFSTTSTTAVVITNVTMSYTAPAYAVKLILSYSVMAMSSPGNSEIYLEVGGTPRGPYLYIDPASPWPRACGNVVVDVAANATVTIRLMGYVAAGSTLSVTNEQERWKPTITGLVIPA